MKKFLFYFRKTIIKNAPAVDAATEAPFYHSLIVFFLSMIISVISIFVQTWRINAADSLNTEKTSLYGVDTALVTFAKFLDANNMDYIIDPDQAALNTGDSATTLATWNEKVGGDKTSIVPAAWTLQAKITDYNDEGALVDKTVTVLKIYDFTSYKNQNIITENLYRVFTNFVNADDYEGYFVPDSATEYNKTEVKNDNIVYTSSFVFLCKDSYGIYTFPHNSVKYTSIAGTYKAFQNTGKLNLREFTTMDDWKEFARLGYIPQKNYTCMMQTTIVGAINVGVTILLGLLLFIMTRGKNNPFRVYKFHQCLATSFWITFTPAVLSLAIGFMSMTFATVIYVMIFGARTAFLASRNFRPVAPMK